MMNSTGLLGSHCAASAGADIVNTQVAAVSSFAEVCAIFISTPQFVSRTRGTYSCSGVDDLSALDQNFHEPTDDFFRIRPRCAPDARRFRYGDLSRAAVWTEGSIARRTCLARS